MSRVLTSSKLVESVRTRAMLPNDTSVYTNKQILDAINEQMDTALLPSLLSINEEHLVVTLPVARDASTDRYEIPYRAIGNKLRDVNYTLSNNIYELSRVSPEELSDYRTTGNLYYTDAFYLEGNEVVLLKNSRNFDFLNMLFYLRPNNLVEEKYVAKITNIDVNSGLLTFSNFPTDFSNLGEFDFVSNITPNKILSWDITPVSADANTKSMIFNSSDIPDKLKVGDYVCFKEETPVPNIPTEYHPILAQLAAIHVLESLGDTEGLSNANRRLDKMMEAVMKLTDNRVEGAPQKIKQRHTTLMQTGFNNKNRRRW
jgi:hypothetical protein